MRCIDAAFLDVMHIEGELLCLSRRLHFAQCFIYILVITHDIYSVVGPGHWLLLGRILRVVQHIWTLIFHWRGQCLYVLSPERLLWIQFLWTRLNELLLQDDTLGRRNRIDLRQRVLLSRSWVLKTALSVPILVGHSFDELHHISDALFSIWF